MFVVFYRNHTISLKTGKDDYRYINSVVDYFSYHTIIIHLRDCFLTNISTKKRKISNHLFTLDKRIRIILYYSSREGGEDDSITAFSKNRQFIQQSLR